MQNISYFQSSLSSLVRVVSDTNQVVSDMSDKLKTLQSRIDIIEESMKKQSVATSPTPLCTQESDSEDGVTQSPEVTFTAINPVNLTKMRSRKKNVNKSADSTVSIDI